MALLQFTPPKPNALKMPPGRRRPNDFQQQTQQQQDLQTHNDTNKSLWRSCWELAQNFGRHTTIHGLNHLLDEKQRRSERIIWILTVLLALVGAIYVSLLLSQRFQEGKFETVVNSTRMPVYHVPFPVVTICNANRLNWQRIDEAKELFLPNEKSPEKLKLFEKIIGAYDDIRFAKFDKFDVLRNEPVAELNHVNFSLVFDFMTWRCEEFLTNCRWRHSDMNCCQIFSKRRSKSGICWSFNTLETEEGRQMQRVDPMWPWRAGSAGPTNGLNVRTLIHPEKHYPNRTNEKGILVMISEPQVWHREFVTIPENTESDIDVEPIVYFHENDTRRIPSNQRECVFDDETNSPDFRSLFGYIYMIENCQAECHQQYLMRYCNCSVDLLFPPGQFPPCKAKDLLCLAANNERFLYSHQPGEENFVRSSYEGMVCKCYRNCYSRKYNMDVRRSFLPEDIRKNVSYVDLDVHYRAEIMVVYRTNLVFGWVDLMVAFGGIAGLFLGCSLISGIELGVFLLVHIPTFVVRKLKERNNRSRIQLRDSNNINFTQQTHTILGPMNQFMIKSKNHNNLSNTNNNNSIFSNANNKSNSPPAVAWDRVLTSNQNLYQKNYNAYF